MERRMIAGAGLLVALGIVTALLVQGNGVSHQPMEPVEYTQGFEAGLGEDWVRDSDVPEDPNTGGLVNWSILVSDRQAASGVASGLFGIDGSQDDGTIWLERSIPVDGGSQYRVDVSAKAYSEQSSFNVIAHMVQYAGLTSPEEEEDFPQADTVDTTGDSAGLRKPLAREAGWDTYNFSWTTPMVQQDTGEIHVAVGLSVVWETGIAFLYDDIEVTVTPVTP